MIVQGLNENNFLVGNPIQVKITPDSGTTFSANEVINLTIVKKTTHFNDPAPYTLPVIRLYPKPNGFTVDLAPMLIGLLPDPFIIGNNLGVTIPNFQEFDFFFSHDSGSGASKSFLSKRVIRGFKRQRSDSAATVQTYVPLSLSERIPTWSNLPVGYATVEDEGMFWNNINFSDTSAFIDRQKTPSGCKSFYIRFMNSLGGYNYWLFPLYEIIDNSDSQGFISNSIGKFDKSLGLESKTSVAVTGRVKKEYYGIFRDLIVSPVVQVYNTQEEFGVDDWVQLQMTSSTFSYSNNEVIQEVNFTFDIDYNINPTVSW